MKFKYQELIDVLFAASVGVVRTKHVGDFILEFKSKEINVVLNTKDGVTSARGNSIDTDAIICFDPTQTQVYLCNYGS